MAADPLVFDSDDTAWRTSWNQTSDQWSELFAELRSDYLPVDIEIVEDNGQQRVSGTWIKNTDGRGWAAWRNLSHEGFSEKWSEYRDQGYRLVDQESYVLGGERRYAGIWVENTEGYAWLSYRNLTAAEYQNLFDDHKDDYLPVDIDVYEVNGSLRYSAAFVENATNLAWQARHGLSGDEFADLFNSMRSTHRVTDIESYDDYGQQRYAVVWTENENGRGWASRRDLSEKGFRNEFFSYRDRGYRLVDMERYQSGGNWRYAAVWRQNGDRLNWDLRSDVDTLVMEHRDEFNVP
ncbi:MAG: penicillin-binding protein, partial [Planctomycetes bacterium]|nr:penicillin-binding protein [Planctomycetota bacterium]